MLHIKRNNLLNLLYEKQVTVAKITTELGVSQNQFYRIIKRKNTPSVALAKSIANSLGITIDDIFEFEDEKPKKRNENGNKI